MAVIDSVYSYYVSTYGTSSSRYDTHKKSELRNIYNNILKINKESPLYKIKNNGDVHKFAIDIKEHARNIKRVISSLSSDGDDLASAFQKKVAISSDDDIVSATYIGDGSSNVNTADFQIEVKQLAKPQTNLGQFLKRNHLDLNPDDYSFDLDTTSSSYEFQFTVNENDTNQSILEKLSRLINTSGVGLASEIISDDADQVALKITSNQTGLSSSEDYLFQIKPGPSAASMHAMNVLGLSNVSSEAQNSKFLLNGVERTSYGNVFTINNAFELTLNGISEEGKPSDVGFKTSVDAVADNIKELVDAYNGFIASSNKYRENSNNAQLYKELTNVASSYRSELEAIGLVQQGDGSISIDKGLLSQAIDTDEPDEIFSVLNSFKNSLAVKADTASINPMKYVNKVIIEYKNPGKNFSAPYVSSIYSGMMLDTYC